MNKASRSFGFSILLSLAIAVPGSALAQHRPGGMPPGSRHGMPSRTLTRPVLPMASPSKEVVKNRSGEQFFIVASIDQQNSQLLLKRPTEVTELVKIDSKTKYLNDQGKPMALKSFRAGDTVWAKISDAKNDPTLIEMRLGEMTVPDLHKYYLDYPIIK
ncbi:MAG: hypothetical protein ACRD4R_05060 [Candidatus Acidiferrales bacterium]